MGAKAVPSVASSPASSVIADNAHPRDKSHAALYWGTLQSQYCGELALQVLPAKAVSARQIVADMHRLGRIPMFDMRLRPDVIHTVVVDTKVNDGRVYTWTAANLNVLSFEDSLDVTMCVFRVWHASESRACCVVCVPVCVCVWHQRVASACGVSVCLTTSRRMGSMARRTGRIMSI